MNHFGFTAFLKIPFRITICFLGIATVIVWTGAWLATGKLASHRLERQIQSQREGAQIEADITASSLDKRVSESRSIPIILADDPSIKAALVRFGPDVKASTLPQGERARVWSSEPVLASVADRLTQIVARFDLNSIWISNASGLG